MKAVRVTDGIHVTDLLGDKRFVHGKMYTITFPDGTVMDRSVIVTRTAVIQYNVPFMVLREQAFFAVDYRGLKNWTRAIDLDDIVEILE